MTTAYKTFMIWTLFVVGLITVFVGDEDFALWVLSMFCLVHIICLMYFTMSHVLRRRPS
jgi:hypothetical protein